MNAEEIRLMTGDLAVDGRGIVSFVNDFDFAGVRRFYMVENHSAGFVRAWHAHRHEAKYVMVTQGAAIVAAVKIENWHNPRADCRVHRYVLSGLKPSVLYIPAGYANGFKSLTSDTKVIFFSTSTLEESKGDDVRWPADYFGDVWTVVEQ
jgi:dTDP-4-dehydrorhamnose 3,5-epimerase-like enzyme